MREAILLASGGLCSRFRAFAHFRTQSIWIDLYGSQNDFSDLGGDYRERELESCRSWVFIPLKSRI